MPFYLGNALGVGTARDLLFTPARSLSNSLTLPRDADRAFDVEDAVRFLDKLWGHDCVASKVRLSVSGQPDLAVNRWVGTPVQAEETPNCALGIAAQL
jgi:hypothetical protein